MIKGTNYSNPGNHPKEGYTQDLVEINKELYKQISILKTREQYLRDQLNKLSFNKKSIESRLDYHTHQLRVQSKKCELLEMDLDDFNYAACHHFKTPIRNISSFVQLLKKAYETKSDFKEVEFMEFVSANARHLNELLEDLLFYTTFTQHAEDSFSNILPDVMLSEIKLEMHGQIEANDASLIIGDLPMLRANSFLLKLLFKELIENALKFRRELSPVITVESSYHNKCHIISVKDNGIGLKESYAPKVFSLFGKLHNSEKYPGTGLGLALCRKILHVHKGEIWYTSKRKDGTTFHFSIPDDLLLKK